MKDKFTRSSGVPLFEVRNLSFSVGAADLLRDISIDLFCGELTVILGPNGAGKSTFLKLLTGEHSASSGKVFFNQKELSEWSNRELARRRAVLPQASKLPFDFLAHELVMLGRAPHGDASESAELALKAMRASDCEELAERSVGTLSGGELQRVHLARVLLQIDVPDDRSRALFLDEPTSNLDPFHQHRTMRVAREAADAGCCVVVVLHDMNLAATYADRLLLLQKGNYVAEGPVDEVMTKPRIEQLFQVRACIVENPLSKTHGLFTG
ncbi:MAG: heme ABC transporter ATP-binding protein [Chthoniobacterales bacterium]